MKTMKLSEDAYDTLIWLLSAYLMGDVVEVDGDDDTDEDTYQAVRILKIQVERPE